MRCMTSARVAPRGGSRNDTTEGRWMVMLADVGEGGTACNPSDAILLLKYRCELHLGGDRARLLNGGRDP